MRGYFVVGTDGGCGKTTVAAAILTALRLDGRRVAAMKPVETGCELGPDGILVARDGLLLREACGEPFLPLDLVAPRRYQQPIAPALAARHEGRSFSLDTTRAALARLLATDPDLVLIEGIGGLLVPYAEDLLTADVARALTLPLLIVGRASQGTLNHTLLTIAEARHRNLPVKGVILSRLIANRSPEEADNAAEIERLGRVPVLGTLPHLGETLRRRPDVLTSALRRAFDPTVLLR